MRLLALAISILLSGFLIGQGNIVPLTVNSNLKHKNSTEKVGDAHNTYIYVYDTLSLPFIDDFSENHFPSFEATNGDPNVTSSVYYRIEVSSNPVSMGSWFMTDTTFHFEYDTVTGFGFDSIILVNKTALPFQTADIFNIDNFPITSSTESVWPPYNIFDSLWSGTAIDDTVFYDLSSVDVYQDSAMIYFVSETAEDSANVYWQDIYAYHNYTYAKNIQTLGVVTFDGLDETGYPYDFSSVNSTGLADVLTSKPIDMSGLTVADSVYFSFLVEPGGYGENPDLTDSLVLQFWSPLTGQWKSIWHKNGYTSDQFKMQLIKITNPLYFQNGFQFRFKSYGALAGSLDVWHIDYVHLDKLRSYEDTLGADWAFSEPSPSFIKDFTSMPWPHYEFAPEYNMVTDYTAATYNSASTSPFINPCNMELYYGSNLISTVSYGITTPNVPAKSRFEMDYTIPSTFWFDTIFADTCANFEVIQYIDNNGLAATELLENDTLRHTQHFCNYYSYDDGTAEAAFFLGSTNNELGIRYNLAPGLVDTIRAVSIHFSPNSHDVTNIPFFLQIWDDYQGEPGNLIYTSDQTIPETYYPSYSAGNNGFTEYALTEKVIVSGTYYVGFKQTSSGHLNIGFDRNTDNRDKLFVKTTTSWVNGFDEGTLMIRPVFVSDRDYVLRLREISTSGPEITVYPNPANDWISFKGELESFENLQLIDLQGRILYQTNDIYSGISTSSLPNGVYLIQFTTTENQVFQKKISILH